MTVAGWAGDVADIQLRPENLPDGIYGRDWTHIKITARKGVSGRILRVGAYRSEVFAFDDPRCVGEAA